MCLTEYQLFFLSVCEIITINHKYYQNNLEKWHRGSNSWIHPHIETKAKKDHAEQSVVHFHFNYFLLSLFNPVGRINVKTDPFPGRLSTLILP